MTLDPRCDVIAGQLLLCHRRDWAAEKLVQQIREHKVEHVEYGGELADRLHELDLESDLSIRVHLLHVPKGQEQWKVGHLHEGYRYFLLEEMHHGSDPAAETLPWQRLFQCTTNSLLSAADESGGSAVEVELSADHARYGSLIGFEHPMATLRTPTIMVLDTGVAPVAGRRIVRERNFVGGVTNRAAATDDHGHGSVVCAIIADLLPFADLIVYKVADAKGRVSEWDALCALAASTDADVINMSLVFGLQDRRCHTCGIQSGSSRSAIFEYFLDELARRSPPPIIVGAAGNKGEAALFYPARFGSVVAISSVTGDGVLSSFSNYGPEDHDGEQHPRRFVLPGGGASAPAQPSEEFVAMRMSDGHEFTGTSFAAAYASAVIGGLRSVSDASAWPNDALLDHLIQTAIHEPWMTDQDRYGNGLMHLTPPDGPMLA